MRGALGGERVTKKDGDRHGRREGPKAPQVDSWHRPAVHIRIDGHLWHRPDREVLSTNADISPTASLRRCDVAPRGPGMSTLPEDETEDRWLIGFI